MWARDRSSYFFEFRSDCMSNFKRNPRGLAHVATIRDRDWISLTCGCPPQEYQLGGPRICRVRAASFFACSCRANANVGNGSHDLTLAGFRPKPLLPRNFVQLGSCCLERMVVRYSGLSRRSCLARRGHVTHAVIPLGPPNHSRLELFVTCTRRYWSRHVRSCLVSSNIFELRCRYRIILWRTLKSMSQLTCRQLWTVYRGCAMT